MSIAEKILDIIGPAVLLAIPAGQKAPKREAWQKLTPADMTPEYLASLNHGDNIGVSLGKASNGLCTADCDADDILKSFLEVNPALGDTLAARGARGGNVWVRIIGEYPKSCAIRFADGKKSGRVARHW